MSGKGSQRRPCQTTREEKNLRELLAYGKISFAEYEEKYKKLLKQGKITRSGRKIK